jgi:hypothetical protein
MCEGEPSTQHAPDSLNAGKSLTILVNPCASAGCATLY